MTYNKEFLWADSVGDREPPKPKREQIPNMKPDAHLAPWDIKQPIIHNKDGTTSSFRILQPSDYRSEELKEPWDEEELLRSQREMYSAWLCITVRGLRSTFPFWLILVASRHR